MTIKHTPGPWEVSRGFNIVATDGRRSVATTGGYSDNMRVHEVDAENRANARLIAEAPAMRAFIQEVIDTIKTGYLKVGTSQTPMDAMFAGRTIGEWDALLARIDGEGR